MNKFVIDMWYYIVRLLPKRALYFSYLHILAHSTTGKYGNTNTAEIPAIEALKRWSDDYKDKLL